MNGIRNITHATVKFSDRFEAYYTSHTVETIADFENVCRAYIRGDGPGGGAVTVEILSSRSRRYPAGSTWYLVWEENEPGYFLSRKRGRMIKIEMTDTFGGEANYSWVRRYQIPVILANLNGQQSGAPKGPQV
jgi:hypothetical protein